MKSLHQFIVLLYFSFCAAHLGAEVVLITGASRGIGFAVANQLAARPKLKLILSSRSACSDVNIKTLMTSHPQRIFCVNLDVANQESVTQGISNVIKQHGQIHYVVANAGILGALGSSLFTSEETAKKIFDVNYHGLRRVINAVLPSMLENKSGRIVNVGSIAGSYPSSYLPEYSAAKFAAKAFAMNMDCLHAAHGIRIVTVEPGFTNTTIDSSLDEPLSPAGLEEQVAERNVALVEYMDKLHKGQNPDDVALVIINQLFIADPDPVVQTHSSLKEFLLNSGVNDPSGRTIHDVKQVQCAAWSTKAAHLKKEEL